MTVSMTTSPQQKNGAIISQLSDTNPFFSEEHEYADKIKPDLEYLLDAFNLADYIKVDYYVSEKRYNNEKENARISKRDFVERKVMPISLTDQMAINMYWKSETYEASFITAKLRLKKNMRQFIRFCSALNGCWLGPKGDKYKKFDVYLFRNVDGDWKIINMTGYDCRRAREVRSAKSYTKDLENGILFLYKDTFYSEKETTSISQESK